MRMQAKYLEGTRLAPRVVAIVLLLLLATGCRRQEAAPAPPVVRRPVALAPASTQRPRPAAWPGSVAAVPAAVPESSELVLPAPQPLPPSDNPEAVTIGKPLVPGATTIGPPPMGIRYDKLPAKVRAATQPPPPAPSVDLLADDAAGRTPVPAVNQLTAAQQRWLDASRRELANPHTFDTMVAALLQLRQVPSPEAVALAAAALGDANLDVRVAAITAVRDFTGLPTAPLVAKALADDEPAVRRQGVAALAFAPSAQAQPALLKAVQDPDASVVTQALDAALRQVATVKVAVFTAARARPEPALRQAWVGLVARDSTPVTLELLLPLLDDAEPQVAAAARRTVTYLLGQPFDDADTARAYWDAHHDDYDGRLHRRAPAAAPGAGQ